MRLAKNKKTGDDCAIKYIKTYLLDQKDKDDILKEVKILAQMDHPNIVRLFEFYEEPNKYCIV